VTHIQDWLHNCIRCGNCKYVFRQYDDSCPSGRQFHFESYFASGRIALARALMTGELEWDKSLLDPIFACTACGSCETQCLAPHREHIVDIIEELRAEAVTNIGPLAEHSRFKDNIVQHHNPYGVEHHARKLSEQLGLPERAKAVFFVGCTSNYKETAIRDATLSVLKKTGVDFTIVDEYCCGSPLLRTGQRTEAHTLAEHNARVLSESGATSVITACSGCYRTLAKDYPELGVRLQANVVHTSQLVDQLLRRGLLKVNSASAVGVTYHDPCHLGRHCDVYDAPRNVLRMLGYKLHEMELNRENAWCCGAGGGVKSAYPEWSVKTGSERIAQARTTGADTLVSACPFCKRNLTEAAGESMKIVDIMELVDSRTV